jgi:hypothetical protein
MNTTQINDPTLTVDEFCAAERISKAQLYLDWKKGQGPDYFMNGKCRRISHEARIRWRRAREEAAKLAQRDTVSA